LPLLVGGTLVTLVGALRSSDRSTTLVSLAVLSFLAIAISAPIAVYRRFYRMRLVVERQLDRGELCPKCGYSLEALLRPICPECGRDFGKPSGGDA